jgi:hypothetical protein
MEATRPSRAKAYFDEIRRSGDGADFLKKLVGLETPTYESEFLEFKGAFKLDLGDGLLELWAKNLSGFANSDGGVLIFGIDAPKGAARNLSLAQDLNKLSEKLKNTLPRIIEPPVQRVEIESYPESPGSNKGFVVCHIPSSPWRPHQVRTGGQPGLFYIRASDNCIPCNHATLRTLFAPQLISVIEILYRIKEGFDPFDGPGFLMVECILANKGPATARDVFVRVRCSNPVEPRFDHGIWEEAETGGTGKALICKQSIHPEEQMPLCRLSIGKVIAGEKMMHHDSFSFQFSVSARNQAPTRLEVVVTREDILDGSLKTASLMEKE